MKYLIETDKLTIFVPVGKEDKLEEIKLGEVANPLTEVGKIGSKIKDFPKKSIKVVKNQFIDLFKSKQKVWSHLKAEDLGYLFTAESKTFIGFKEER